MILKELDLGMDYASLGLKTPEKAPSFQGLILQNYDAYRKER